MYFLIVAESIKAVTQASLCEFETDISTATFYMQLHNNVVCQADHCVLISSLHDCGRVSNVVLIKL